MWPSPSWNWIVTPRCKCAAKSADYGRSNAMPWLTASPRPRPVPRKSTHVEVSPANCRARSGPSTASHRRPVPSCRTTARPSKGLLSDDQGAPLRPPEPEDSSDAPGEVRQSLERNLQTKKGALKTNCNVFGGVHRPGTERRSRTICGHSRPCGAVGLFRPTLEPTLGPCVLREQQFETLSYLT